MFAKWVLTLGKEQPTTAAVIMALISIVETSLPPSHILTPLAYLGKEQPTITVVIMPQIQILETSLQPSHTLTPLGKERPTVTAVIMPQIQIITETPLQPKCTLTQTYLPRLNPERRGARGVALFLNL